MSRFFSRLFLPKKWVIKCARCCTLALLCLLLGSCSTKLSYNFLDWWLAWNVRDHISLNREQRKTLNQHIDQFHQWHRQSELKRYTDVLKSLQSRLQQGPLETHELYHYSNQAGEFWQASLRELIDPATQLLASLSNKQKRQLLDTLEEKFEIFYQDRVDLNDEELYQQRLEQMKENLSPWVGRLSPEQQTLVQQWARELQPNRQLMFQQRQQWRNELAESLNHKEDMEILRKETGRLLLYPEEDWLPAYRDSIVHNQQQTLALLARINNSLTEKQILKRDRQLQRYIDDFTDLHCKGSQVRCQAAL